MWLSRFIEDKLGQKQLLDIRTQGLAAHAEYGTYIFNDGLLSHLKQFPWILGGDMAILCQYY